MRQIFVYDTWAVRDLPVLAATVSLLEQSYMVTVTDIAAQTGLDSAAVTAALEALDPVYVDFRKTTTGGDPRFWYVFKATPQARRAVGQWPTGEALASRLAEELAAAARQEPDSERQGLLSYAARLIGDTLRDVTVRAAGQVLAPAFGGVPQPEFGFPVPEPQVQPAEEDFPSLVPLPELPELLRPERPAPIASVDPASRAASDDPAAADSPAPVQELGHELGHEQPPATGEHPNPRESAPTAERSDQGQSAATGEQPDPGQSATIGEQPDLEQSAAAGQPSGPVRPPEASAGGDAEAHGPAQDRRPADATQAG